MTPNFHVIWIVQQLSLGLNHREGNSLAEGNIMKGQSESNKLLLCIWENVSDGDMFIFMSNHRWDKDVRLKKICSGSRQNFSLRQGTSRHPRPDKWFYYILPSCPKSTPGFIVLCRHSADILRIRSNNSASMLWVTNECKEIQIHDLLRPTYILKDYKSTEHYKTSSQKWNKVKVWFK